ncbi:NAD(P)-dependent dehydrogenase (short-subunit alcohol dehydrogenase family) [Sphingomonas kaistensis]|uniref:NAD(P)-dependent dehydrogenase (Short-subunit alcohol dehydrogenase family) n=1 Tax=Sphingomonas kaistensis TaxID=298708 RepID=A0A7X5Y7E1_9SPHN|nr:SDR family oxidoreductase [Sphingomonas kaistensis]NJC04901.1 NAD(P)-dependent dehydrogenase (short-subunit alcohol dehydrogenase family) [Sphingomonas kaistensis]
MPTLFVTGANRGLGLEFVRQYREAGWDVIATVRETSPELESLGAEVRTLDMADAAAVSAVRAGRPIDLLIANAGTYGPRDASDGQAAGEWLDTFAVNTIAPYLLAQALLPEVRAASGKLIVISTRMGSLADNSSGGFLAYRSSKTALNMAWQTLALANPDLVCVPLHPGWVQTRMGGESAPVVPKQSIAAMRRVIDGLTLEDSGKFFDFEGKAVPW